ADPARQPAYEGRMTAVPIISTLRRAWPPWRTPASGEGLAGRFGRLAEGGGLTLSGLARDIAGLALGPGRVGLADYERLRLYDAALWGGAARREIAGAGRARRLARQANFRRDCLALAND